jgi:hypothetical protein
MPWAINRIEAADCVAENQKPLRERRQPFVMTLHAGRVPMLHDVGDPLGILDDLVKPRRRQRLGKCQEACFIDWRIIPKTAEQTQMPRIVLDFFENPATR